MKKFIILLSGIFILNSMITTWSFGEDKAAAPAKVTDPNQKTFEVKCVMCHGKDGKGKASMASAFKVPAAALDLTSKEMQAKSDADLIAVINSGKNKMPAYAKQLTPDAVKGLVAYLRSLAPPSK